MFGTDQGFGPLLDFDDLLLTGVGEANENGQLGFALLGLQLEDHTGRSVASAGDIDGDGFDDLIVGAPQIDQAGGSDHGESYVLFGGNLTGAVTQIGTSAAETLTGSAAADRLVGAQGDDTLEGGGGLDLDLTGIADNRITGIEAIDLRAGDSGGGSTLTLGVRDVLNLSDESNTLTIAGDNSDAVIADFTGATKVISATTTTYTLGAMTVVIDNDVDQSGIIIA